MEIQFYKYQGTGNDFIIIDNRNKNLQLTTEQINKLCDRKFGIGADGLMLMENAEGYDFKMVYYNADGNESTMCGNGGRCLVKFANDITIQKETYLFTAIDGAHIATIDEEGWVRLKMNDVNNVTMAGNDYVLNTGSPHYIKKIADADAVNVYKEGYAIRNNDTYKAEGINVNFVEQKAKSIKVRTYERGVEDETLSCGTGVTAAALVMAKHGEQNKIPVETLGGNLRVEFYKKDDNHFENIWLCGPATFVFKGEIEV